MLPGLIKILFIINPLLEKKRRKDIPGLITRYLDTDQYDPTILYSDYPGHARLLADQNVDKFRLIVGAGGDGTINQVAQSLINTETVLGILPMGSGNGFARSLGIPLNMAAAIKMINRHHIRKIDTGMIGTHRFINIAGIGFASEVASTFADSKMRGFLSYAMETLKTLFRYSPVLATITHEGGSISDRFFIVSLANLPQWGYGAYISPLSRPDDGLLEISIIKNFPKIMLPDLLVRLFRKTIHRSGYVEIIPLQKAVISDFESLTGHIDGEPVEFSSPLSISIDPGSLQVICNEIIV